MNKKVFFYTIFIIFLITLSGCIFASSKSEKDISKPISVKENTVNSPKNNIDSTPKENSIFEQRISSGSVTVELEPTKFENGKLYISAGINTHTVDLDQYDLKKMTTLTYKGKTVYPESIPDLSGHHNSGIFIFQLDKQPEEFVIKITGLSDIQDREFRWP